MKKLKTLNSIEAKIKEYNKLLVTQTDLNRIKELKSEIMYFYWGIVI